MGMVREMIKITSEKIWPMEMFSNLWFFTCLADNDKDFDINVICEDGEFLQELIK